MSYLLDGRHYCLGFIAMEYVKGKPLHRILGKKERALALSRARGFI